MPVDNACRHVRTLRQDWTFVRDDPKGAEQFEFNDSAWDTVRVPHDWAITGPFDREHDLQEAVIWEDGERRPSFHTGRTGGLPHVGVAWYRRRLEIPAEWQGKRVFVEFDGVMSHSRVYLNGAGVGTWPFGYASFCFELTEQVQFGSGNVLAVRVDNKPCASRWYPGAGIYRHVRLVVVDPVHVGHWGTAVTTERLSDKEAVVRVRTDVENQTGTVRDVTLTTSILSPDGSRATGASTRQTVEAHGVFEQSLTIPSPVRWDVGDPLLYTAVCEVNVAGTVVDRYETPFGLRTVRFDANEGFFLNGRRLRLNGVCMHHDLGPLGAAMNRRALERQLEILADMGCNAIRTSHNPPAPELLELCDAMGFLVIDEAFDEWQMAKVDNGYHTLFDEWAENDLRAMIRRDRNHPCVIMWSIGNEIGEQHSQTGADVARFLTEICHDQDPTRPVTAGFNNSEGAIKNGLAAVVDIPGWNYKPHLYEQYHRDHPDWITYGSETESCVSSRGEYYFPVEEERDVCRPSLHVPSYDMAAPPWGYPPDCEFRAQDDCPFMLGEFVWTGFDYLGEPTPYKTEWPSRSSYFGIVDLCGIPKDRFYLYRSRWSDADTLHLLPHWNWEGREGEITPVHCYTSHPAAELFLNGRSLGVKRKDASTLFGRYRLVWDDVRYEPGALKVVARNAAGQPVAEKTVRTAGPPARVELTADRAVIAADGLDLAFVTVRIVDDEGTTCPLADDLVAFTVEGPAEIAAVGNGDQTSVEPFLADHRRAFHGLCMLILRSAEGRAGEVRVRAEAQGLAAAEAVVETQET